MKKFKRLAMICALSLMLCGFTTTAHASGVENANITQSEIEEVTTETEAKPLTPDGNLTLIDDIDGEQSDGKEFVTVQSKSGNYFYLVIDRDGDKENVYFLNLVDEADLLALIEDAPPTEPTTPTDPTDPTPPTTDNTESPVVDELPTEETDNSSRTMLALVLVVGLIGGGAFYYFKVIKAKKEANTTPNLDEYEYEDEDDEELVLNEFNEDDFEDVEDDSEEDIY